MRSLFNNLAAVFQLNDTGWTDALRGIQLTGNNSPTVVAGKIGNAVHLVRASNQSLSIGDDPNLSMPTGTSFTVSAWGQLSLGTPLAYNAVAKGAQTTLGLGEYILSASMVSGAVQFRVLNQNNESSAIASSPASLPGINTWFWMLGEYDYSTGKITCYLNNAAGTQVTFAAGASDTSLQFNIGRVGSSLNPWGGDLDEVLIWKRVLTGAERSFLYGGGSPPAWPWGVIDDSSFSGGMREQLGCLGG